MKAPFYIPYVFVIGSLKRFISGGIKVKIKNSVAITNSKINLVREQGRHLTLFLNISVSAKYVNAAAIKKIEIFTQSGVLPNRE